MKMETGIYRILNLITGMYYIGRALNFDKRWKNHRIELNLNRHCNPYLQNAWNKWGEHNFEFQIVQLCDISYIIQCEQYWLDQTKCYDRTIGYNLVKGSEGRIGHKASPETRALLSALKKGKPRSEETKAKIRASTKGRIVSAETREKQRQAQLGSKKSEETKLKHAMNMKGNKRSEGSVRTKAHLDAMFEGKMKKKFLTW